MSWWVNVRDKLEALFGHAIEVAGPIVEQAAIAGAVAAAQAKLGGASNHDAGQAAISALKTQAPELEAKVTLALSSLALANSDAHAADAAAAVPPAAPST